MHEGVLNSINMKLEEIIKLLTEINTKVDPNESFDPNTPITDLLKTKDKKQIKTIGDLFAKLNKK